MVSGQKRKAGFETGDVITAVNGRRTRMSESELIAYLLEHSKPGDRVALQIVRQGVARELILPMQ